MANLKGCFSHNSDHWATPKFIYDFFGSLNYLDPCPLHCETDNLSIEYDAQGLFINPPYSDIKSWVDFAIRQVDRNDCDVVLLVPSRTDTKWFQQLIRRQDCYLYFVEGRLHFNDGKSSAPFPSVFICLGRFAKNSYFSIQHLFLNFKKEVKR